MSKYITVRPEDYAKAVYRALAQYGDDVLEITDKCAKDAARQTRAELKASTPAGGEYAAGWSRRKQSAGAWGISQVVYNRLYMLVHLLEKPHTTGGGGHYPKNVDYTGTVERVEEKNTKKFMEEVIAKL